MNKKQRELGQELLKVLKIGDTVKYRSNLYEVTGFGTYKDKYPSGQVYYNYKTVVIRNRKTNKKISVSPHNLSLV